MKDYELTVLFHPDLEMNLDPAIDKVKKIITTNGGTITKEENEGKKRLAYSINGQGFAVYYYFDVQLPAEAPAKISNVLNITDETFRDVLVTVVERRAKLRKASTSEEVSTTESEKAEKGE